MKILLKVLGVLTVMIALLVSSVAVVRNFRDAKDVVEIEKTSAQFDQMRGLTQAMSEGAGSEMEDPFSEVDSLIKKMPSSKTFYAAGIIIAIITLLNLVTGVFLFIPSKKTTTLLFVTVILLSIISIVVSPEIDSSLTRGAISNRTLAMIVAGFATVSALFPFLLARKKA